MASDVPHTLVVTEAKHAQVTTLVREVLQARGARFDEQTPSRTVFEDLPAGGGFSRGGYAGTYQAIGDPRVEVLLEVWAPGPRRFFWAAVVLTLLAVPALMLASPPSAVFFFAGLGLWALLIAAGLMYYLTFRGSAALEEDLAAEALARLRGAGLEVLDEEQQLERAIRERLEGEVKEREVAARTAAEPPPPRLGRGRGEGPGTPPARKPGLFGRGKKA